MFEFDLSEDLLWKIKKLTKKEKNIVDILHKKIREIINNDAESIDRYKNLKYSLKNFKRVHINSHFVLIAERINN